jgi:hypothetical protein
MIGRRARRGADPERGAVTVEAALGMCSLVVLLGMILAGLLAVTDQLRCTDAAREAARLLARGERTLADVAVGRLAPSGARLMVRREGQGVAVLVSARPVNGLLPGVEVRGSAFAVLEPAALGPDVAPTARRAGSRAGT